MAEKKGKVTEKKDKGKVRFTVVREFAGGQTMQEAFERLIEKQTAGRFEEWRGRKAG